MQLKKEAFGIRDYLRSTTEEYALAAQNKGLEIAMNVPENLPPVLVDVSLIQRVIQNLMDNAVKYTLNEGRITIVAQMKDKEMELSISNSGPGIPVSDLPNLFDRYYKVNREKDSQNSSGLGLAIVKKILDIHESVINVTSGSDQLTVFRFSLQTYLLVVDQRS